jgi:cytidine deaminase|tara:strand:+ start:611 stop:1114 length:504 start_codon:yes stop_codon:yes gene_type:complete
MKYEEMEVKCVLTPTDVLDLPEIDKVLLKKAHEAATKAYAPYSGFQVGSAVRLQSGAIVVGSNQENMAYPSGLCGERVAVFAAGAQFPGEKIEAVAIVSPSPIAVPSAFLPCGGCRQVLLEAESRQEDSIRLLLQARDEIVLVSKSAINLVPFAFTVEDGGLSSDHS